MKYKFIFLICLILLLVLVLVSENCLSEEPDNPNEYVVFYSGFEEIPFDQKFCCCSGWLDSYYGYAHSGEQWAYSWTMGDTLMPSHSSQYFKEITELRFWYCAESSTHPMDMEVYCNGNLVWSDYGYTHTIYEEVIINLSNYYVQNCAIEFVHLTSDFYGTCVDDVLIITHLTPPIMTFVDDDFNSSVDGWAYDHFNNIQDGIDAVDENGTVYVYNGTYYENLVVNKSIELVGEDRNLTVIDGNFNDDVIKISSNNCSIKGFQIRNSGDNYSPEGIFNSGIQVFSKFNNIFDCIIKNNLYGIFLNNYGNHGYSSDNTINMNYFTSNKYGLGVKSSNSNIISKNIITNNEVNGLSIEGKYNLIKNNTIISNNQTGVAFDNSDYNYIIENNILQNYDGISFVWHCNFNVIQNNTLTESSHYGLFFMQNNTNNLIYNNFFQNNINIIDDGNNIWNISKTSGPDIINGPYLGGNYWSDYNGYDADGDGLGDNFLPYGPGDYLPLTNRTESADINQSMHDRGFPIRHAADGDWAGAQDFTPTLDYLTKCEIYLRKFGTPEFNLTVDLREDHPQGTLIDSIVFTAENVSSSWTWLELDFTDIEVNSSKDYFIVCPPAPSGVTTSFGYEWGYAFGNQYDDGSFWFTRDGGALWRDLPTMYEFVFRTYGYS